MQNILSWVQIILSVILIGAILLQERGSGTGSAFGSGSSSYSSRRGIEKVLFITTIIVAILFFLIAALSFKLR